MANEDIKYEEFIKGDPQAAMSYLKLMLSHENRAIQLHVRNEQELRKLMDHLSASMAKGPSRAVTPSEMIKRFGQASTPSSRLAEQEEGERISFRPQRPQGTFAERLQARIEEKSRMTVLPGRIPKTGMFQPIEPMTPLNEHEWADAYNHCRTYQPTAMDTLWPVVRGEKPCKFIITEGGDPALVWRLYQAGLIDTLYVSHEMEELRGFPTAFKRAVQTYHQRLQASRPLYFRFVSSFPSWNEKGEYMPGLNFIRMGQAGAFDNPEPSTMGPVLYDQQEIAIIRAEQIQEIFNECMKISARSEMKVNYSNPEMLLITRFVNVKIAERELEIVQRFAERIDRIDIPICPLTKQAIRTFRIGKMAMDGVDDIPADDNILEDMEVVSHTEDQTFPQID